MDLFFGGGGGGMGMGGGHRGMMMGDARVFETQYQCFSTAMAGRTNIDEGDKILLPPSALDALARMNVEYPMLFELRNDAIGKKTHCGVMEFSAEEGRCYMPFWMMQHGGTLLTLDTTSSLFSSRCFLLHKTLYFSLPSISHLYSPISSHFSTTLFLLTTTTYTSFLFQLEEGQLISVKNVSLAKATFVKFRAQSCDFLEVSITVYYNSNSVLHPFSFILSYPYTHILDLLADL